MRQTQPSVIDVTLPDFRNLGVMLRSLVLAEFANMIALVSYTADGFRAVLRLAATGLLFETTVLCVILLLFVVSPWLRKFRYQEGTALVIAISGAVAVGLDVAVRAWVGESATGGALKAAVLAMLLAALILSYFNWRQRIMSPALADARLIALQARVRPHFLFNSLNTAVALIRQDARKAEEVLLDMADLFRVLLADKSGLVQLGDEIRVATGYVEIEQLRLGERLRLRWDCTDAPLAARVPLLMLQPLLENAVRYGVEPSAEGGDIVVTIGTKAKHLVIEVQNSVLAPGAAAREDNWVALANIEERLGLHFDAEAKLDTWEKDGQFIVRLSLPVHVEERSRKKANCLDLAREP